MSGKPWGNGSLRNVTEQEWYNVKNNKKSINLVFLRKLMRTEIIKVCLEREQFWENKMEEKNEM